MLTDSHSRPSRLGITVASAVRASVSAVFTASAVLFAGCAATAARSQVTSAPPPAVSPTPVAQPQHSAPPPTPSVRLTFQEYRCKSDSEIGPSERATIESVALSFTTKAFGTDVSGAYAMMTAETKATLTAGGLAAAIGSTGLPTMSPTFKVDHAYLVESNGSPGRAICGALKDNRWISVAMGTARRQAHAMILGQTRNNDWQVSLWLWPDNDGWKVHLLHVGLSGAVGLGAEQIFDMARRERREGHPFNAFVLYVAVRTFLDRGPALQLGLVQAAESDYRTLEAPPELRGQPPYVWSMNGTSYGVSHVAMMGVGGQIGLVIELPQREWNGEAAADSFNHEFLNAFVSAHSDYARVFEFVLARAVKPDGSGAFGTVYEAGKGFTHEESKRNP